VFGTTPDLEIRRPVSPDKSVALIGEWRYRRLDGTEITCDPIFSFCELSKLVEALFQIFFESGHAEFPGRLTSKTRPIALRQRSPYSLLTNHKPLSRISALGEWTPNQSADGPHSRHSETVDIILASSASLFLFAFDAEDLKVEILLNVAADPLFHYCLLPAVH
jgi:hypothetical protein